MSEYKCECGMDSHMNQITEYPVGAKVIFEDGEIGMVTGHCEDGRATIDINGTTHTFHLIHTWVDSVVLPGDDVATLKRYDLIPGRDLFQIDEYGQWCNATEAFAIIAKKNARIAELEKLVSQVKDGDIVWDTDSNEWMDSETYAIQNNDE